MRMLRQRAVLLGRLMGALAIGAAVIDYVWLVLHTPGLWS